MLPKRNRINIKSNSTGETITAPIIINISFLVMLFFSCSDPKTNMERIDTHIHLYDTHREGSCIFLDSVKQKKIYYPHLIEDFVKTAHPAGIKYAVVVEASYRE